MSDVDYDVVIVGGRPAGASLAARLGRRGIDEATYTDDTSRIDAFTMDFDGHFEVMIPVPMIFGRDHVAGIDRALFDHVLWKRLEKELYEEPPEIVIRTLIRWLLSDPEYQHRFLLFLGRAVPPDNWLPPSLVRAAALRGALKDLKELFSPRHDKNDRC